MDLFKPFQTFQPFKLCKQIHESACSQSSSANRRIYRTYTIGKSSVNVRIVLFDRVW